MHASSSQHSVSCSVLKNFHTTSAPPVRRKVSLGKKRSLKPNAAIRKQELVLPKLLSLNPLPQAQSGLQPMDKTVSRSQVDLNDSLDLNRSLQQESSLPRIAGAQSLMQSASLPYGLDRSSDLSMIKSTNLLNKRAFLMENSSKIPMKAVSKASRINYHNLESQAQPPRRRRSQTNSVDLDGLKALAQRKVTQLAQLQSAIKEAEAENRERLQLVDTIEDLVHFKVKTAADKLKEGALSKGGSQAFESTQALNAASLTKAGLNKSSSQQNSLLANNLTTGGAFDIEEPQDSIFQDISCFPNFAQGSSPAKPSEQKGSDSASLGLAQASQKLRLFEDESVNFNANSSLNLKDSAMLIESQGQASTLDEDTLAILTKLCDPLLRNEALRSMPKAKKKGQLQRKKKETLATKVKASTASEEQASVSMDPYVLLKRYFDGRKPEQEKKERYPGIPHSSADLTKVDKCPHLKENFIAQKYAKLKANGSLKELEDQIQKRQQSDLLELPLAQDSLMMPALSTAQLSGSASLAAFEHLDSKLDSKMDTYIGRRMETKIESLDQNQALNESDMNQVDDPADQQVQHLHTFSLVETEGENREMRRVEQKFQNQAIVNSNFHLSPNPSPKYSNRGEDMNEEWPEQPGQPSLALRINDEEGPRILQTNKGEVSRGLSNSGSNRNYYSQFPQQTPLEGREPTGPARTLTKSSLNDPTEKEIEVHIQHQPRISRIKHFQSVKSSEQAGKKGRLSYIPFSQEQLNLAKLIVRQKRGGGGESRQVKMENPAVNLYREVFGNTAESNRVSTQRAGHASKRKKTEARKSHRSDRETVIGTFKVEESTPDSTTKHQNSVDRMSQSQIKANFQDALSGAATIIVETHEQTGSAFFNRTAASQAMAGRKGSTASEKAAGKTAVRIPAQARQLDGPVAGENDSMNASQASMIMKVSRMNIVPKPEALATTTTKHLHGEVFLPDRQFSQAAGLHATATSVEHSLSAEDEVFMTPDHIGDADIKSSSLQAYDKSFDQQTLKLADPPGRTTKHLQRQTTKGTKATFSKKSRKLTSTGKQLKETPTDRPLEVVQLVSHVKIKNTAELASGVGSEEKQEQAAFAAELGKVSTPPPKDSPQAKKFKVVPIREQRFDQDCKPQHKQPAIPATANRDLVERAGLHPYENGPTAEPKKMAVQHLTFTLSEGEANRSQRNETKQRDDDSSGLKRPSLHSGREVSEETRAAGVRSSLISASVVLPAQREEPRDLRKSPAAKIEARLSSKKPSYSGASTLIQASQRKRKTHSQLGIYLNQKSTERMSERSLEQTAEFHQAGRTSSREARSKGVQAEPQPLAAEEHQAHQAYLMANTGQIISKMHKQSEQLLPSENHERNLTEQESVQKGGFSHEFETTRLKEKFSAQLTTDVNSTQQIDSYLNSSRVLQHPQQVGKPFEFNQHLIKILTQTRSTLRELPEVASQGTPKEERKRSSEKDPPSIKGQNSPPREDAVDPWEVFQEQFIQDHLIKQASWVPDRFRKHPRFRFGKRASTSGVELTDSLIQSIKQNQQFISLNPSVYALLSLDTHGSSAVLTAKEGGHGSQISQKQIHPKQPRYARDSQRASASKLAATKDAAIDGLFETNSRTRQSANRNLHTAERDRTETQVSEAQERGNSPRGDLPGRLLRESTGSFKSHQEEVREPEIEIREEQPALPVEPPLNGRSESGEKAEEVPLGNDRLADDGEFEALHYDPFQRVLLGKKIDNQILTSFRTMAKQNNVLSKSLKIVHKRFQPPPQINQATRKKISSNLKSLYKVPPPITERLPEEEATRGTHHLQDLETHILESQEMLNQMKDEMQKLRMLHDDPSTVEGEKVPSVRVQETETVTEVHPVGQRSFTSFVIDQQPGEDPHDKQVIYSKISPGRKGSSDEARQGPHETFQSRSVAPVVRSILAASPERQQEQVEQQAHSLQAKTASTMMKKQQLLQQEAHCRVPLSIYDITAGQNNEEVGYGYLRSQYKVQSSAPKSMVDKEQGVDPYTSDTEGASARGEKPSASSVVQRAKNKATFINRVKAPTTSSVGASPRDTVFIQGRALSIDNTTLKKATIEQESGSWNFPDHVSRVSLKAKSPNGEGTAAMNIQNLRYSAKHSTDHEVSQASTLSPKGELKMKRSAIQITKHRAESDTGDRLESQMAIKEVVLLSSQKKQSEEAPEMVHTRKLSTDDQGLDRLREGAAATQVLQTKHKVRFVDGETPPQIYASAVSLVHPDDEVSVQDQMSRENNLESILSTINQFGMLRQHSVLNPQTTEDSKTKKDSHRSSEHQLSSHQTSSNLLPSTHQLKPVSSSKEAYMPIRTKELSKLGSHEISKHGHLPISVKVQQKKTTQRSKESGSEPLTEPTFRHDRKVVPLPSGASGGDQSSLGPVKYPSGQKDQKLLTSIIHLVNQDMGTSRDHQDSVLFSSKESDAGPELPRLTSGVDSATVNVVVPLLVTAPSRAPAARPAQGFNQVIDRLFQQENKYVNKYPWHKEIKDREVDLVQNNNLIFDLSRAGYQRLENESLIGESRPAEPLATSMKVKKKEEVPVAKKEAKKGMWSNLKRATRQAPKKDPREPELVVVQGQQLESKAPV